MNGCAAVRVLRILLTSVAIAAGLILFQGDADADIVDNRLEEGQIVIKYADGDEALAERSMDILQNALDEYSAYLNRGGEPIRYIICPAYHVFAQFAGPQARLQVEGLAWSEEGVVVVKAPRLLRQPARYGDVLRHELVHVMLARTVDLDNLPRWLNEGAAMSLADEYRWRSSAVVAYMYTQGRIMEYQELMAVFEVAGGEMEFGDVYAQSLSMTRFLKDELGEERFWSMIRSLQDQPFPEALAQYGAMTPVALWDAWQGSLWKVALIGSLVSGFSVFQMMALLTVWAYLRKRGQRNAKLRQWEVEETPLAGDGPLYVTWDEIVDAHEGPWEDSSGQDEEY
ncbi:MAG: hypothetical protein ACLFU6_01790 [Candidatus Hydrogenedentota bacterium]